MGTVQNLSFGGDGDSFGDPMQSNLKVWAVILVLIDSGSDNLTEATPMLWLLAQAAGTGSPTFLDILSVS